jgi:carboxymethylenebutenolidase
MIYSLSMERRNFLERITQLAGSAAIVPLLQTDSAMAQIVAENDARLVSSTAEYDAAGTKVTGYLARLKGGQKRPAVLVIHENRGLNPHIQDVARRVALEGFLGYAPDMMRFRAG